MGISAARTAGDTRVTGELMLEATDVRILRRQLDRMLGALHLFDPHLRLAHRDLSWIVWQLIDVQERALHLLGGIALQHVHRHATSLSVNNRRAALLELIANRHHGIRFIGSSRGGCWESQFSNRCLKLLARDAMCQHPQLRQLTYFALVVIGVWCLIPLRGYERTAHRSPDRLVIHLRDSCRH